MKYIRTKDGKIYAFYDIKEIGDTVIGYVNERDKNALDGGSYFGKKDIRVADTIEQLCDEFIHDLYDKHRRCHYSQNTKTWFDEESGFYLYEGYVKTIKGAIWTDKGLIYVAKLNDEGELELL